MVLLNLMMKFFLQILFEKGYTFTTSSETAVIRDMKEKFCFAAQDCEEFSKGHHDDKYTKQYTLPSGQVLTINEERTFIFFVLFLIFFFHSIFL